MIFMSPFLKHRL